MPMLPADVQLREDALLGAAFRRCVVAMRKGSHAIAVWQAPTGRWCAAHDALAAVASEYCETPAAALTALADALEARE